ncbi:MAG: hypothetical protein WBA22_02810 [Candidatus Methanofastidiosia archaeon]
MEQIGCYQELCSSGWHISEKRIENLIIPYFEERGYKVASHCLQDQADMVAAEISHGAKIETIMGIEIKSRDDTMKRLDSQIAQYIHLFDFVYVVLEAQELPASIPPFVGIIRVTDNHVTMEREAHQIGKTLFPWCFTDAGLARTIKTSNGIQNRYMELKAYLSVLDDLRRKLLYNCIFWDDPLPLTEQEKTVVNFVEKRSGAISELGLFEYRCGRVSVATGESGHGG